MATLAASPGRFARGASPTPVRFKDGVLHIVGFSSCGDFNAAINAGHTLEQHGAIKAFRPIAHGREQQFRAWLLNHPQGRKGMQSGAGKAHDGSPFCWIEWQNSSKQYIGGLDAINDMIDVTSPAVESPISPFVELVAAAADAAAGISPARKQPRLSRLPPVNSAALASAPVPDQQGQQDPAPPLVDAAPPLVDATKFMGPDGKPEKRDGRPPVMDMPKSLMKGMPAPFHIMKWICGLMSSAGAEEGKARLITIPYSHYCERARWVLSMTPLAFTEDGHPPGFHMFPVTDVTGDSYSATPVLVLPGGETVTDSAAIVRRLVKDFPNELALLYPAEHAADITALEAEMATTLGANVRQVAYTHVLDKNYIETITPWLSKHSSRVEAFLYSMTSKTIAKGMIKLMRCRYSRIPQAEYEIDRLFARLEARLAGGNDNANANAGKRYLFGDALTAADITFATLVYPLVLPKEMDGLLPPPDELPAQYRESIKKYRATAAGQHALRIYRDHRFAAGAPQQLIAPNTRRDVNFNLGLAVVVASAGMASVLALWLMWALLSALLVLV